MSAEPKEAKDEIGELKTALQSETQLRLEVEDRLRRTIADFQEFVLAAAHDLRAPLRNVGVFCELLLRKDVDHTDAEMEQFRRYIAEGTARIQELIAGMVEYASAASESRYHQPVDMNEVFREAAAHAPTEQRVPAIALDTLPVVRGDFDKLVKVVRQLLNNAARYCVEKQCRVHVSARREASHWLFLVSDNGPGIDPAYSEKIFAPFARLHGREHAGSGLGLAFCRKAIESQGGRIWVESRLGVGSIFHFSLPAAD